MKKIFFITASFSLILSSCFSNAGKLQDSEREAMEAQEITRGVVHRVYESKFKTENIFYVRLNDGTVLEGEVAIYAGMLGHEDFFFVQPGDTIVYNGEEVLEVRFKD